VKWIKLPGKKNISPFDPSEKKKDGTKCPKGVGQLKERKDSSRGRGKGETRPDWGGEKNQDIT